MDVSVRVGESIFLASQTKKKKKEKLSYYRPVEFAHMKCMPFPSFCEARVNSLDGLCSSKPGFPKSRYRGERKQGYQHKRSWSLEPSRCGALSFREMRI